MNPISVELAALAGETCASADQDSRKESRGRSRHGELRKSIPELLAANKCPDFIEDKGHYFGTDLTDDDKHALIEYLKTF